MTLCTKCKLDYIEHDEGMLQKCNRVKDEEIKQLKFNYDIIANQMGKQGQQIKQLKEK